MKYHSFYMRVLCLLLIIGAVMGYNFMSKNNTQAQEIEDLKERVTTLESQQTEILTALENAAKAREEAEAAAEAAKAEAAKADSENTSKTTEDSSENSGDDYYKDGTYTGSGQGFGGTIEVQVTLKDDEITDIQVTSASGEDSAYLSQGEGVISSIISAQSTDVDTISHKGCSSAGVFYCGTGTFFHSICRNQIHLPGNCFLSAGYLEFLS